MERSAKSYYLTCVFDSFFTLIASFILSLIILSYFTVYPLNLIFSVVISLLICLFIIKKDIKKAKKEGIKISSSKNYIKTITTLNFFSQEKLLILTKKLYEMQGKIVEKNGNSLKIKQENAVVFLRFGFDKINKTEIVKIFNKITKTEKAIIVSNEFDKEIITFSKRFNGRIVLINGKEFYEQLKKYQLLPLENIELLPEHIKPKFFYEIFDKKKAKKFFLFGLTFLLFSYFVPIKLYYVVCGGIFLIYSIILIFFGKTNEQN